MRLDQLGLAMAWYRSVKKAHWRSFEDLRHNFPSADRVGRVTIFDWSGNRFRLIAVISYPGQRVYFKALLTHAQYDRKEWMKWA